MKAYLVWGQLCSAPCIVTCLNFGVVFIVYVIFIVPFLGRLQSVRWVKKNGGFSLVDGGSRKHLFGEVKNLGVGSNKKNKFGEGSTNFVLVGRGKKGGWQSSAQPLSCFPAAADMLPLSSSST